MILNIQRWEEERVQSKDWLGAINAREWAGQVLVPRK